MGLRELAEERLQELRRQDTTAPDPESLFHVPPSRTEGVEQAEQRNTPPTSATESPLTGPSLGRIATPETLTEAEIAAMLLAEFAASGLVLAVRSSTLGEVVVFAADNARVDPGERRPVYRASELEALADLAGLAPDELRQIHRVKRTFRGSVLA